MAPKKTTPIPITAATCALVPPERWTINPYSVGGSTSGFIAYETIFARCDPVPVDD